MEEPFKVVDRPTGRVHGSMIRLIKQVIALPEGKALEIPKNGRAFNSFSATLYGAAGRLKVKISMTQTPESFIVWRRNGNSL